MNWLIYHVASGTAFFSGAACMLIAAPLSTGDRRWVRRVAVLIALVGIVLVTISATPLSVWFYAPASGIAVLWLFLCDVPSASRRIRLTATALLTVAVAVGVALEAPYHVAPSLAASGSREVIIFGDSVTAGMGEDEAETWPAILARTQSLVVHDYSQMGATTASVLKKAKGMAIPEGIVLLEIGGNDLLGSTTPQEFRRDLEALLEYLTAEDRQIAMLELPLPPFRNEFGRIQRDLADRFAVALVPKRVFMSVLSHDEATLDSIHLSQTGHQLMAEAMWSVLQTALKPPPDHAHNELHSPRSIE